MLERHGFEPGAQCSLIVDCHIDGPSVVVSVRHDKCNILRLSYRATDEGKGLAVSCESCDATLLDLANRKVIGIGAGADCSGQVLVLHDMLDIYPGRKARFVRNFMHGASSISGAIESYVRAVKDGSFPAQEHCF